MNSTSADEPMHLRDIKTMSPFTKFLFGLLLVILLFCSIFLLWVSKKYTLPIMMYHHVGYGPQNESNYVSPENFLRQMKYLYDNHYNVISLGELTEIIKRQQRMPKKTVVITFDDGYTNNYEHALDVLEKFKFPATVFVSPGLVGQDDFMTWEQVKAMDASVVDIGSHTVNHAYLPDLNVDEQFFEISESKSLLEEQLGRNVQFIAYPVGGFSEKIKQIVRDVGYKGAVTTNRGYDPINQDVYELNRIRFSNSDVNGIVLKVKLSGYYNVFRSLKSPY